MPTIPSTVREQRFACTQCGACCNRSPEVELSEAATLADVFVFRLMFRLYQLPCTFAGYAASRTMTANSREVFHQSKRLLSTFAARKYSSRIKHGEVEFTNYLTISALTLDTDSGACSALSKGRCGIYERRPLACRTVPFHYSRPEADAERNLQAFVGTAGYACDTGMDASVVLEAGRIVDPSISETRTRALHLAESDRRWKDAILRRMRNRERDCSLPSLQDIETDAAFGVTTTSMRVAWQIAAETGLISADRCEVLIAAQAAVIDRELASAKCDPRTRETLIAMRFEYKQLLKGDCCWNDRSLLRLADHGR